MCQRAMCVQSLFLKLCDTESADKAWKIHEATFGLGNKSGKHIGKTCIWYLHTSSENVGRGNQGAAACQGEIERPVAVGAGGGERAQESHNTEQGILP